jgi:flagellar P-ring protein precursor FlgI
MRGFGPWVLALAVALALPSGVASAQATVRLGDLVIFEHDVPRRLVGYGLVLGLAGTGDRSFGGTTGASPSVRSVANLLNRFGISVPSDRLRLRNVAAVLVTAELSPYLGAGGRFDVQVASLGDATSLQGGVLWMTPLIEDVGQAPSGTAQGPVIVPELSRDRDFSAYRRGNSGLIPGGGIVELERPQATAALAPKLLLRQPDLATAARISEVINGALGAGKARIQDPGVVLLNLSPELADSLPQLLARLQLLAVAAGGPARLVVNIQDGGVAVGGDLVVGAATVSHGGLTLTISETPGDSTSTPGSVQARPGATVADVARALRAAGARPAEVASVLRLLHEVGALAAEVVLR